MSEYEKWKNEFSLILETLPENAELSHWQRLAIRESVDAASRAATSINRHNVESTYKYVVPNVVNRKKRRITNALSRYIPDGSEIHFTGEPLGAPVEIVIDDVKHVLPYNNKVIS